VIALTDLIRRAFCPPDFRFGAIREVWIEGAEQASQELAQVREAVEHGVTELNLFTAKDNVDSYALPALRAALALVTEKETVVGPDPMDWEVIG
jgi:hypothetical protein